MEAVCYEYPLLLKRCATYYVLSMSVLIGSSASTAAEVRTWTDRSGENRMEAEFTDFNDGKVFLHTRDGSNATVPIGEFSVADQDFVRKEVQRRMDALKAHLKAGPGTVKYAKARKLCDLAAEKVDESSGIACSHRAPGVFWTHNDSGDHARLYAFNREGKDLGSCLIEGADGYDFEDMASFVRDGKPCLLVGDIGNNGRAAGVQILHLVEEPPIDPERGVTVEKTPQVQTIYYSYEDDFRDCEALAVDPVANVILLVSKERLPECYAYVLPWPDKGAKKVVSAKRIAALKLPRVTGMDISPDGLRAVLVTYGHAYEFTREKGEDWSAALKRLPAEIELPPRPQGESICFGPDGKTLYFTSEGKPAPLWEVPAAE